jgi:hypothetical protein
MAGETSAGPSSSPPSPAKREGPKIRTLACPKCGGSLTVRGLLQTESIACGACGSVLDLTDENLRIISTFQAKTKIQPLIPLGARGKLVGDVLEVIGYLRRKVTVEGVDYEWGEYLLFNPYKGFRWLSEYNGHWTFIRTLTERPVGDYEPSYLNRTFKHFQGAMAVVSYVIGEFFWRVEVGEKARVDDFVSPPYLLSRETSAKETVWSLGQYVQRDVIRDAFKLPYVSPPIGVYSCQPAPYGASASRVYGLFGWFLAAAVAIHLLLVTFSQNKTVYRAEFNYLPSAASGPVEKSFVTDVFELPGRASNVMFATHANVSNNWIYLNLALINDDTGQAYDFGREISYYFGRDSDGSWSEGSPDDEAILPAVPPGRYYLRIEPENGGGAVSYSIRVVRDVPRWSFFLLTALALLLFPCILFWRQRAFEVRRWAESDHPMLTFSSGDDD